MSKNNVRIAIRDSTDSHNVAFFDNKAGIKYKSANLQRFLAGSASILTLKYNSKDIDSIRSGCKLAFRYKNRDYWLNVMNFEKKGFEVELTAYSLGLELNNETRGEHKPSNAMSIAEYVAYYDPEHALTIGVNEVSDKRIKLEWTGTDTILARLFSVANSFGAELDFSVELNDDYSLKRQVLNIYKKGNLGTNKVSQPVRVGKELKVINYSDNIKELRTAVRATGKDGLTIDGLNKKIYDSNKQLLYYSSGMTVYAPQSRDRFPSVGKGSNDNWIVEDLGETQYETKEALWGYMYGEIQKKSLPEITYEVEGAIEAGIGDTQTLIDDIHFEPALYVQARVSELEDDILTGKVTKSTFINFERKYSQIADILLKQVEALAEDAAPYIIRLSTDNGYIFKNGEGSSTITARLEKYSKDIAATWKWVVDNKVVGTGDKLTVKAEQVTNTMAVTVIAYVNGNEVVRDYMTFSNSDDGVGVESIDRYFTSSDQSDGVTIEGAEWSDKPPAPTEDGKYLWAYDEITYTDGTVTTTKPAAVGANFDVDAFRAEIAEDLKDVPNREEFENKISEEIASSKAEIETQIETAKTQAESNAKEYAETINQETAKVAEQANAAADEIKADLVNVKNNLTSTSLVANNAQAAVDEAKQDLAAVNTKVDNAKAELTQAKQDLANVASDLNTAKQDLTDSVSAVNTKVDSTKEELTQAKQDLVSQAQQLQTQANAQTELTKRVTTVETTANGTKTTVNELTKTVAQNGKDITSVTNRTKTVEDDLANTKTTLTQVQTTANSASQKTATLESGLDGLSARFDSLKIGAVNLLHNSKGPFQPKGSKIDNYVTYSNTWINMENGKEYTLSAKGTAPFTSKHTLDKEKNEICLWLVKHDENINVDLIISSSTTGTVGTKFTWKGPSGKYYLRVNTYKADNSNYAEDVQIEEGNLRSTYSQNEADIEQKVAEYKQTADQNYASLSSTVQTLDGQVQSNKTTAEQTAAGFKTRIESLETYKDGESTRANQYFESAKTETAKQLTAERTAIANNYVAKSTYTSDVTGIRNDLTATTTTANTTKTNLANYQASNDRAVANLQSNLQTANGNISSLKTKVEAVPGQITSAVSAVEGKIPTSAGGRNLAQGTSKDWSKPFTGFSGVQNICPVLYRVTTDGLAVGDTFKTRIVLKYTNIVPASGKTAEIWLQGSGNVTLWKNGTYPSGGGGRRSISGSGEIVFELTDKIHADHLKNAYWELSFRTDWIASGSLQWKLAKAERGMFFTDWSPAPEDTINQISSLSSELKQTKDGITLLATKTELNTAKSDLQSGINTATSKANNAQSTANSAQNKANSNAQTISTHTTQISALNSGLSAKVSQSDFNTLSGRVTTAENNITAKANELSSKITSVEGKIPTEIGGVNLLRNSKGPFKPNIGVVDNYVYYDSSTVYLEKNKSYVISGLTDGEFSDTHELNQESNRVVLWLTDKSKDINEVVSDSNTGTKGTRFTWVNDTGTYCLRVNTYKKVADKSAWNIQVEKGNVKSDYAQSPLDTDADITRVSSEIQQTADGMTLLATKTELNNAKNDLQFGINTATNKANSAQNTANSNAQTISTHTTQISALNSGLSAKVSQSDFNTLSGRVTTAENNITAKANELSSKITSVEGKIPTEIGGVNLLRNSKGPFKPNIGVVDNYVYYDSSTVYLEKNKSYVISGLTDGEFSDTHELNQESNRVVLWLTDKSKDINEVVSDSNTGTKGTRFTWVNDTGTYCLRVNTYKKVADKSAWNIQVEKGNVKSDYAQSPLDTDADITRVSSEIQQTADGMTLLATKTELNNAKNDLQFGINTATNKANSAQNTANSNAQTISTHTNQISALNSGLSAKVSQSDFNTLSGRVTTAENNITAKANELSSKITSVEGKIPTEIGGVNLLRNSKGPFKPNIGVVDNYVYYDSSTVYLEKNKSYVISGLTDGEFSDTHELNQESNRVVLWLTDKSKDINEVVSDSNTGTKGTRFTWVNDTGTYCLRVNTYKKVADKSAWNIQVEKGNVKSDYAQSPLDTDADITKISSEIQQTTDAIKASVSSLDKSTVKSSSLTINADGIVMKAGKSTTDVANAIGSYFAVNQNAINLFSDKINVKGNMIVNGAITSDKIASKQINTAHLNGKIITADVISSNAVTTDAIKAGAVTTDKMSANSINGDRIAAGTLDAAKIKAGSITASQIASGTITSAQIKAGTISAANIAAGTITGDNIKANSVDVSKIVGIDANYIKAKIEYAMIDWLKGKTITAYNDNMTIDLQNGRISFKDGSNAVYRQTPDGIHTGFMHFEAGSLGGIYAAFGATSTRQGINSKSSEFAGIRCYRVSANGDSHDAKIDKIEVIGDTVQFGHGYRSDGSIGGGFIMDNAAFGNETPYSMNRVIKSIEALWRILHDHAKNTGYRFNDPAFINALNNEYNAWHDMHND